MAGGNSGHVAATGGGREGCFHGSVSVAGVDTIHDSGNVVANLGGGGEGSHFRGTVGVAGHQDYMSDSYDEIQGKCKSCLLYLIKLFRIKSMFKIKKQIPTFKVLQQRIKKAAKAGCCFELDVTDLMDRCQMGNTLSEEEVQIISYYLHLTAGEEEVGEEGEDNWEFNQHTH